MGQFANISGRDAVKAFVKFRYTHSHTSGDHAILQKAHAPTPLDSFTQRSRTILAQVTNQKGQLDSKRIFNFTKKIIYPPPRASDVLALSSVVSDRKK